MKELNTKNTQHKLRNKFLKIGVKMVGPETIFFKRSIERCYCLLVQTAIEIFLFLHQIKNSFTTAISVLSFTIFSP